jgi:hypothetical protein
VSFHRYKVLISIEVLQLRPSSARDREAILRFLEGLAENPFRLGDYQESDQMGRPLQIKIVGKLAFTYWADHAVQEVKVTKIEKADRD